MEITLGWQEGLCFGWRHSLIIWDENPLNVPFFKRRWYTEGSESQKPGCESGFCTYQLGAWGQVSYPIWVFFSSHHWLIGWVWGLNKTKHVRCSAQLGTGPSLLIMGSSPGPGFSFVLCCWWTPGLRGSWFSLLGSELSNRSIRDPSRSCEEQVKYALWTMNECKANPCGHFL